MTTSSPCNQSADCNPILFILKTTWTSYLVGQSDHLASEMRILNVSDVVLLHHGLHWDRLIGRYVEWRLMSWILVERNSPVGFQVDGVGCHQARTWRQVEKNIVDLAARLTWHPAVDLIGWSVRLVRQVQLLHLAPKVIFGLFSIQKYFVISTEPFSLKTTSHSSS